MVDVDTVTGAVVPFLYAAAGAYGTAVVQRLNEQASDATADATVRMARRVWHRMAGSPQSLPVTESIAELGRRPDDPTALELVRGEVRAALTRDRDLVRDVAQMLTHAGKYTVTVTGGHGVVVGDHNTQTINVAEPKQ